VAGDAVNEHQPLQYGEMRESEETHFSVARIVQFAIAYVTQ